MYFDFAQPADRVVAVAANQQRLEVALDRQHLVIPASALVEGENNVEIEFLAGDAPLNRQDDFLYSLFVPARASLAMPVFDQPDLKAKWQLTLNVPPDWTARVQRPRDRTNRRLPITSGSCSRRRRRSRRTCSRSRRASSASRRRNATAGRSGCSTAKPTPRRSRATARPSSTCTHARSTWLEDYTAIPYPFGKFDFVLIPSFQFGGMEHPGAIYYNASGLLLDESATQNQFLGRASVISHETAHMWFGDLVTMRWFNDVWMKEVFANFMAAKIVNPSFPAVNHELRFLYQHYPSAYEVDRTDGANPIRQDLANLNEAGSLYGAIIYQKAPIVMRQLELLMGAGPFRDGLREYLKAHSFGNATWSDLIAHARRARRPRISRRGAAPGSKRRAGPRSRPSSRCRISTSTGWRSVRAIRAAAR